VANADRFIPYSDGAFTNVLSVTARMNSPEFRRVLHSEGQLLVAVPGPEDLVELRGAGRDRVEQTIQAFSSEFVLRGQRRITTTADLEADSVQDVLLSIYRPNPAKQEGTKRVTFSLDLLLFSPS
jgi:hypothetical protein